MNLHMYITCVLIVHVHIWYIMVYIHMYNVYTYRSMCIAIAGNCIIVSYVPYQFFQRLLKGHLQQCV